MAAIAQTIDGLPRPARRLVSQAIKWELRGRPSPDDLELGASPTDRGLFVGWPVREEGEGEGGELEDHGDIHIPQGEPHLVLEEGESFASPEEHQPGGTIVLFIENIRPLTNEHVARVVLHELAHFFGNDEAEVAELGFT